MSKEFSKNALRASILTAAIPHLKEYTGKYVVAKYGGNAMTDPALKRAVMEDILLLHLIGVKIILVHGGGPDINAMLKALNIESQFKDGLRVTDQKTMEVVQMVLAGKVNKGLCADISANGGYAVGLCGIDGDMLQVHTSSKDLGLVGEIDYVDTKVIENTIAGGFIPVISSIGIDAKGQPHNINADTAAAKIAGALKAEAMVFMSNINGVMKDPKDPTTLYKTLSLDDVRALKHDGTITGGMIPKVDSCVDAVESGCRRVFIINGEVPHSILIELLTSEGLGTMFVK